MDGARGVPLWGGGDIWGIPTELEGISMGWREHMGDLYAVGVRLYGVGGTYGGFLWGGVGDVWGIFRVGGTYGAPLWGEGGTSIGEHGTYGASLWDARGRRAVLWGWGGAFGSPYGVGGHRYRGTRGAPPRGTVRTRRAALRGMGGRPRGTRSAPSPLRYLHRACAARTRASGTRTAHAPLDHVLPGERTESERGGARTPAPH